MMFTAVNNGPPPLAFFAIFPIHILTMLLMFALTAFYIVNVFRNERVNKDTKVLWAIVIFMGSIIAMPIYWYLYIWPEDSHKTPAPQLGTGPDSFSRSASPDMQNTYVPPRQPPDWR